MQNLRSKLVTFAAVGAAAVGGATIANAASSSSTATPSTASSTQSRSMPQGPHTVNGKSETALAGDTATKVEQSALTKVSGTVDRVETNVDGSAPYEAHVTKSDGTQVEVQVSKDFSVVAVNNMPGHP